jgi:hypothetical protein
MRLPGLSIIPGLVRVADNSGVFCIRDQSSMFLIGGLIPVDAYDGRCIIGMFTP